MTMLKKIFDPGNYDNKINFGLLFLRVTSGIFMLTHGVGKLAKLIEGGTIKFADPIGVGPEASLFLAVFAEFFCSFFLIFGIATRFSAIPLIITMLVAGFISHAGDAFASKEKAFLFLVIFVAIAITGAGKYSIDNFTNKKLERK
ncbi:MAG: DoxX family protein [Ignavibacteriaceae bacterium]|nr:DoxX family protein [Ignavibacteriaceae bacterium]